MARALVAAGAGVNAKDAWGWRPLHETAAAGLSGRAYDIQVGHAKEVEAAVARRYRETVKFLVAAGADVNARDKWHRIPLQWAIITGHDEIVALLVAAGPDIDLGRWKDTASLVLAVKKGHTRIIAMLLAAGMNVKGALAPFNSDEVAAGIEKDNKAIESARRELEAARKQLEAARKEFKALKAVREKVE